MFVIKMMRMEHTLSFAAEELKKYLRMMMPQAGEIEITLEPGAKDGFRLGLLEDFDIPFEGKDTFWKMLSTSTPTNVAVFLPALIPEACCLRCTAI